MAKYRKIHDGVAYLSVGAAANLIGTSTAKIKQLMGDGTLDWCNLRDNGRIFITENSAIAYKRRLVDAKHATSQS